MKITNQDIISLFTNAAAALEVTGANRFRIRAYQNAIATLEDLDEEVVNLSKRMDLDDLPGIGKELAAKMTEYISSGKVKELDELFSQVPSGMFSLLNIPGLGPKRAYQLANAFHLDDPKSSLKKVKAAVEQDKVKDLPGWGVKSQEQLKESLMRVKPKSLRMRLDTADKLAGQMTQILSQAPTVHKVHALGSLRRRQDTIGDLDFAVATTDPTSVVRYLKNTTPYEVEAAGKNLIRLVLSKNKQVDIKFQDPDKFGATLQHFTGNKAHNIALREYALKKGLSLSEHGIKKGPQRLSFPDETSFYNYLGLEYIPPELRQDGGEIEAARTNRLPQLVKLDQIKGDFHTHTDHQWVSSHDYGDSIAHLVTKASLLGYEWIAFGDHNPSTSKYTESDQYDEISRRSEWIDREISRIIMSENSRTIKYFKTLEVDIKTNGDLAIPDKALEALDFCIVSIHSSFTLNQKVQTQRVVSALNHPKVKIFGHPTGRLIPDRAPVNLDWDKIFDVCLKRNIALEINASPRRLDLPDSLAREAINNGVMISLGTDAHQSDQLSLMPYAVDVARRGWATPQSVLNTRSFQDVAAWMQSPVH